ncbi:phosphatase PAP2 family protein [Streptomyces sp. N2-109]|uniref:Phosphatase PAP2 family protein n=1 Tax=Streptomyces gossypii TaxID=2883101 RepID=A0ABT2JU17_9ACTN|nr:phosphatase PAP2 family protein [Streptomyces gossypii]MCT2591387.1 phosphatase PAP2 family protein [Streptomyces gossypii]
MAPVLCVLAAVLIALVAVGWDPLLDVDESLARELHSFALAHPGWTKTARIFTDWVWDTWTMRALLTAAVLWMCWRAQWSAAIRLAIAGACGTAAQQGLKAAIGRDRPQWAEPVDSAHYAAMPSGHAMSAAFVCGLLLWLLRYLRVPAPLWWTAVTVAGVSVAGVSFTRIYLGVHWLTDVVVGCLLGAAIAACAGARFRVRRRTTGKTAEGVE